MHKNHTPSTTEPEPTEDMIRALNDAFGVGKWALRNGAFHPYRHESVWWGCVPGTTIRTSSHPRMFDALDEFVGMAQERGR